MRDCCRRYQGLRTNLRNGSPMPAQITLQNLTLVFGGAASGKSKYAEKLIFESGLERFYIATSQVYDDEMRAKVEQHKVQRGDGWTTIEEPTNVSKALDNVSADGVVLIDCATLWLTNLMLGEADIDAMIPDFIEACRRCPAPVVVVSNELGLGIVPETSMGRRFRNLHGAMNQQIAEAADHVVFVAAGLPMVLK